MESQAGLVAGILALTFVLGAAIGHDPFARDVDPFETSIVGASPGPATPQFAAFDAVADAFINSRFPDRNTGGSDGVAVGADPPNGSVSRGLLQFNVTGIPSVAVILNATLKAYASQSTADMTVDAHRVRAFWTEGTGSEFAYRQTILVTETDGIPRIREPVDLLFNVPAPFSTLVRGDFRVFDDAGNEVPSQVYGAVYDGNGNVTQVHVVFGATVGASQTRSYYLYFGALFPIVPTFRTVAPPTLRWSVNAPATYAPLNVADLDGDERLEVIVGSSDGTLYVLRADGSEYGRFPAAAPIDGLTDVSDIDGDGVLDILFATAGSDNKIYAIDPRTMTQKWRSTVPLGGIYNPSAILDTNGDGVKEIFIASADGRLYAIDGATGTPVWIFPLGAGYFGQGVSAGDVAEGPEREIIFSAYSTTSGDILVRRPDNTTVWRFSPTGRPIRVTPSLGNFDADPRLDIVAGDTAPSGREFALSGVNASTIWSHTSNSDLWGGQVLVDFDDDGVLETVFALTKRGGIRAVDAAGIELWSHVIGAAADVWGSLAVADVNMDGSEDVLFGAFDYNLYAVDRNGNRIFSLPTAAEISATPVVADLDGDGRMEVVFASRGATYVYTVSSLGHDFRTWGYNNFRTGRFLDGNSPDGATFLQTALGPLESPGGSGVSWRTRDGSTLWAAPGSDYDAAIAGSAVTTGGSGWLSWNVTSIVQGWTNLSYPMAGVLLKPRAEATAGGMTLVSREGDLALRAVLEVTYLENTSPIITPTVPNQVAQEDGPLWDLDLIGFAQDPDTPLSQLRWDLGNVNASLYDYAGGNVTGNHVLRFQPKPDAWGNNRVTLFLFDDQGRYDFQSLWINITPVNDPPLWKPTPPTTLYVKYGSPYTFDFDPYITDIDTPRSQLRLRSDEPLYTSVSGFKVTFSYPDNYPDIWDFVVLTVDDGELSSSESIAVRLTTDTPPELRTPLPDVTLREGESVTNVFDLDDYFYDPDNDALFYSYGFTHLTVTIVTGASQPREHQVDMAALGEWWGVESVTFRASDPTGALIEDTILVTVLPVNDPPQLAATPPFQVHYDEPYVFDLAPYVSDPDNDITEITISTSLPNNITVAGTVLTMLFPYTYSVVPLVQAPYTLSLTIYASDGLNTTFRVTTVTVSNNYPPQLRPGIQLPDVTFFEDEVLADAFDLDDYFMDRDSTTIFYFSGPVNVQVTINETSHAVDFTARPDWYGAELVTFRATDEGGAFAEDTIKVTVRPVNDAPYFLPLPPIKSNQRTFFFNVRNYTADVDDDISELRITTPSANVQVNGFLLVFSYPEGVRADRVNITVSDGQAATTATLEIEIEGPNLLLTFLPWFVAIGAIAAFVVATRYLRTVVEHVFLIYQGGTPLAHLSRTLTSDKDPDLIASMFTAIQSFMNESFHSMGVGDVRSIEMAEHHVAFGRGRYVLLVVLYRGRESGRLEHRVEQVVKDIESKFRHVLADWNGDVDRMAGVKQMLERLWGAKDTGQMFRSFQSPPTPPPPPPPPEAEALLEP